MLPMWEWMHCRPWYVLKYCCSYHIKKWRSHTKRGFPPFPHHTQKWVDIVITRNDFWILVDVIITNLILTDLVQHVLIMITHVTIVVAQNKARSYIEWVLGNNFIPFAIETYDCLYLCFDFINFFYVHANTTCHQ
jgi:hypothetical protein